MLEIITIIIIIIIKERIIDERRKENTILNYNKLIINGSTWTWNVEREILERWMTQGFYKLQKERRNTRYESERNKQSSDMES